jgi:multiple sugar transport system substrate-binding protein
VALDISNYALIYNPDLVSKVPTTFEELVAEAKAQTRNDIYGFAFRHTQAEEAGVWYDLSNYVYGNGGHWAVAGKPTINSPETVAGVSAYKALYDANVIPRGTDAATYRRMFAEGKIAMMIDNGGIPTVLNGTNPNARIAAAPAPLPTRAIGQVMAALAINGNSKHPEAAKAFLAWFLSPEVQTEVQGFLGGSTAATVIPRTAAELERAPYIAVFDGLGDVALPFMPEGLEARTPEIRNIVVEAVLKALAGQTDVKTALDEAQARVEALI